MNNEIRVLLVEDSLSEAKMIVSALLSAQILFKLKQVANENELKEHLGDFKPDIVISNYNVALLDGLSVLKIVKDTSPHLPVIILTHPNSEEIAVACYRQGAHDYIYKNQLERLGPSVQTALLKYRDTETGTGVDDNIKKDAERFKLFDSTVSDILIILNTQGQID